MKVVYLSYSRASTREQKIHGHTCAAQIQEHKEWAERNEVSIDEFFVDDGYSANNVKRPDYLRLISRLKENKKLADGTYLIEYRLLIRYSSRLTRDLVIKRSLSKVFETYNVKVICLNGVDFDGGENADKNFLSDLLTLSDEVEVRRVPNRVKDSYIMAAKSGNYPIGSFPPVGYIRVKNEFYGKGKKLKCMDGAKDTGQKLYEMMASNKYSIRKMRIFMNRHKIFDTTWTDSKVYRYFSNPINYGAFKTKFFDSEDPELILNENNLKGWYDGTNRIHTEPQVSKELWLEGYKAMTQAQKSTKYRYYFKGLVKCCCGEWMIAKSTVKKKKDVYQYYFCSKCKNRINNDKIMDEFLKKYDEIAAENKKNIISDIEERIQKKSKRKDLISKIFEDGDMTSDEYLTEYRKINKDIYQLKQSLNNVINERKKAFNTMDYHSRCNLIHSSIRKITVQQADKYGERQIEIVYEDS